MTRTDKQNMALELETLRAILQNTGNLSLLQNIEESTDKKELSGALDFAVKTLEKQIDNLQLTIPEKIARSFFKGKPGLHFDLTPKNNTTAKPFDFSVISRKLTQLLHGEG